MVFVVLDFEGFVCWCVCEGDFFLLCFVVVVFWIYNVEDLV